MVRKLKYHERKLLKKVDFISWQSENNLHEVKILRKYHIQRREDYTKYCRLVKLIWLVTENLKGLDSRDSFRVKSTEALLEKLYSMGIISTRKSLALCDKVTASSFCRRRLPVVMVKLRMAQAVKDAVKYIEQGHILKYIRVGPDVVTDPAFLVTRNMEDFVTWTDTSKIRKHVLDYHGQRDDFDLM